ncbi:probable mitochondrial import inner membrane translocase subunit TIM21 [Cucurbita maxima]|uniref:Mitochondrial import inner membrane translocase subunit Tim21 n=1 Tax=Cucurbita maxima TaxID=3661 RepID=A0A6J1JQ07_CUCMA|nr:probable mitochondrial import inner membrane translocase subunit TIM21 [Cucurbita maxima]XP_022990406.1 probable mitochondrial import inner membrane translocase subunit TIM21 [Cucurbita maxima]
MANGLMKLTTFVSRSFIVPRQWHQSSSFSRLVAHEYLKAAEVISRSGMNISKGVAVPTIDRAKRALPDTYVTVRELLGPLKSGVAKRSAGYVCNIPKDTLGATGMAVLSRRQGARGSIVNLSPLAVTSRCDTNAGVACFARFMSSKSSEQRGQTPSERKKEISTVEDPFDAPTYNIPEKPVTFAEGASYSFIILAGLGVAAAAGYAVFKELIFQPKEYKIFGKALKRIQDDSQVRVRIGSPITGYGQETRNRAARQRIPNRVWTDEDGVERVEVNFYIRGPHGAGKVYTEMFKDQADKQWKFTYLIVEVKSPSPAQLILESYMPA